MRPDHDASEHTQLGIDNGLRDGEWCYESGCV
jgi:hypothetical protein